MRICVVGAGSIGGLLGGRLARSGQEVTLVARGPHLEAIRERGLRLVAADGTLEVVTDLSVTDRIVEAGPQDLVLLAVKAHQIATVAPDLPSLYGPDTVVVPLQNGIPWWYFHRHGGPFDGRRLRSLDPDGVIERHIPGDRVVGCIAFPAAERTAPGVVAHVEGDRFPVGEPDNSRSERAVAVASTFTEAGFSSRVLTHIRAHLWLKAWGNLSFNPISALTGATLAGICRCDATRNLAASMMTEAGAVAEALGVRIRASVEQRIQGAEAVGEHKTSMLQDVEAGRRLEVDALIGAVAELGRLTDVATPSIDVVLALVRLLDDRVGG